jgi:hypothetical protein
MPQPPKDHHGAQFENFWLKGRASLLRETELRRIALKVLKILHDINELHYELLQEHH